MMNTNLETMMNKVNNILGGEFGFATDDKYRVAINGGVVAKGAQGFGYRGFESSTGRTVDVANFAMGMPKMFVKLPIVSPKVGDLLENEGVPVFVTEIRDSGSIVTINVENNREDIIPPKTGILGFATFTKVFSPFSILKLDGCGSIFQGGEKAMDKILPIAITGGALLASSHMVGNSQSSDDLEGMKGSILPIVAATGLGYILSNLEGSELKPEKLKGFLVDNPIIVAGGVLLAYSVFGSNLSLGLPKEAEGLASKLKASFGNNKKLMMFGGLALGGFFLAKHFGVDITNLADIKKLVSKVIKKDTTVVSEEDVIVIEDIETEVVEADLSETEDTNN